MTKKIDNYSTIQNDKGGFCILKTPTDDDVKDQTFKTFCDNEISVKLTNGNYRLSKGIDDCTCLSCLSSFNNG